MFERKKIDPKKSRKIVYICDGLACRGMNCYIRGGECTHTSHIEHSIKERLKDDFPPTTFVKCGDGLAEQISLSSVLLGYVDGHRSQN